MVGVGRGELTDAAWAKVAPLLPPIGQPGGRWRDHRTVINGILWKLRTGAPWRDLPDRYGPWTTCHDRYVRWRRDGTWDRLLAHAQTKAEAVGQVEWTVSVDSSVVRAHQHAAGARHTPSRADRMEGTAHPQNEALGRSRGGLTTKLHLAVDGCGRPLAVTLTPGQQHDSTQLEPLLATIRVLRPSGKGRPRRRPDHLIADRGYSYQTCRRLLRRRGIAHTIPTRIDQRGRPGRPPGFDRVRYRQRNVVERCVNRLKQWRGIATRFDQRAVNYRAAVVIASLLLWLDAR
jgi:transposase